MLRRRKRAPQISGRWVESRLSYVIDRTLGLFPSRKPSVLVTGFWRSGTTWLQEALAEALNAKTIFEPCSPQAFPPFNCPARFPGRDHASREAYIPLDFATFDRRDLKFLDGVFSGYCYPNFTFECRRAMSEAFRRRAVIKMVRAPFIITELLQRYDVRAVHITRHPCAAVESFLRVKWGWNFEQVKFRNILPRLEAAPAHLIRDLAILMRYDDRPAFERIAAYWAFTEMNVARIGDGRLTKIAYEAMVKRSTELFPRLIEFVGGSRNPRNIERASTQTAGDRKTIARLERTDSWRRSLDSGMCERIQDVVSDLWPEGLCYFQNLSEVGIALPVTNGPSLEISEGGREDATRVYSLRSMQKKASALRP
jgi:hypothetical protein